MISVKKRSGFPIIGLILAAILLLSAYFIYVTFRGTISETESRHLLELQVQATSISSGLEGKDIENLALKFRHAQFILNHKDDPVYNKVSEILKVNADKYKLRSPVYILVYDTLAQDFIFLIGSGDSSLAGKEYKMFPSLLISHFETGGVIPLYEDEFGKWLSAFSPVKGKDGKVTGLIRVDERFNDYWSAAGMHAFRNILLSLFVIGFVSIVLLTLVRRNLKKESEYQRALKTQLDLNILLRLETEKNIRKLNSMEKERTEMLTGLSHDLRTPLTILKGYLDRLDELVKEEETKEVVRVLQEEQLKLTLLINDLFELATLESTDPRLAAEPFQLMELVQDEYSRFSVQMKEKAIDVHINFPPKLSFVFADIHLTSRVLQNILSNALRYTPVGGKLNISFNQMQAHVWISLENSSDPVEEHELNSVFEPYSRLPGDQEKPGNGLGLSIAKKIVELQGGEVKASSVPLGFMISFSLPVAE